MLGFIKRNFSSRNKSVITKLYKHYVRPQLEYAVQAWNPHHQGDIDVLERVQRRATKMISGFRDLTYEERLRRCNLTTLRTRRERGDLIQVYKILNKLDDIDESTFFTRAKENKTRGHTFKLVKKFSKTDTRRFSFSNRIVDSWNSLPEMIVSSDTLNTFKNRIDSYFKTIGKV